MSNASKLAQEIIRQVESKERDLISPGNLQRITITKEESDTLGKSTPGNPEFWQYIQLPELRKIAAAG